jgi:hypothetical protein
MKPEYINESMLDASLLIKEYSERNKIEFKRNKTNKKPYNNDLLDITGNEVDMINKKYKTNSYHVMKRNKF